MLLLRMPKMFSQIFGNELDNGAFLEYLLYIIIILLNIYHSDDVTLYYP